MIGGLWSRASVASHPQAPAALKVTTGPCLCRSAGASPRNWPLSSNSHNCSDALIANLNARPHSGIGYIHYRSLVWPISQRRGTSSPSKLCTLLGLAPSEGQPSISAALAIRRVVVPAQRSRPSLEHEDDTRFAGGSTRTLLWGPGAIPPGAGPGLLATLRQSAQRQLKSAGHGNRIELTAQGGGQHTAAGRRGTRDDAAGMDVAG